MAQREPRERKHQQKHKKRKQELEQKKQKQILYEQTIVRQRQQKYHLLRVMVLLKLIRGVNSTAYW